jgi:glycosyltransferase involved in cell wall biosynthesis
MGKLGRQKVLTEYEIKAKVEQYEDLYLSDNTMLVIGSSVFTLVHFRLQLMQDFQLRGYKVIACAPVENDALIAKLTELGIGFEPLSLRHTSIGIINNIKSLFAIRKLIRLYRPSAILSYTLKPIVFGSFWAKRYNVKKIASMVTGLGYVYSGTTIKQRCLQFVLDRLLAEAFDINHAVIFQNPDDAQHFIAKGLVHQDKVTVVNGSGVDIAYYHPAPYPATCSFIMISRLLTEKGVADYVAAAEAIKLQYPHLRFYLVGKRHNSPSSISQAQLDSWIGSGLIDYLAELDDVRPAIAKASVFVLPSYYREGTPRAILEAMAMARPIITTNMPGCRETVEQGVNGYLVPIKNSEALTQAMLTFIKHPESIIRMGQESRKIAEAKYDVRLVNRSMVQAIDKDKSHD